MTGVMSLAKRLVTTVNRFGIDRFARLCANFLLILSRIYRTVVVPLIVYFGVCRKQYRLIWTELPFERCEVLFKELLGLSNDFLFRAQWLWSDLEGPHERSATRGSLARQGALVEGKTKGVGRVTLCTYQTTVYSMIATITSTQTKRTENDNNPQSARDVINLAFV